MLSLYVCMLFLCFPYAFPWLCFWQDFLRKEQSVDFPGLPLGPGKHEVRDVRAGDEQKNGHAAEHDPQGRSHVADDPVLERNHERAEPDLVDSGCGGVRKSPLDHREDAGNTGVAVVFEEEDDDEDDDYVGDIDYSDDDEDSENEDDFLGKEREGTPLTSILS